MSHFQVLEQCRKQLLGVHSLEEKCAILERHARGANVWQRAPFLCSMLPALSCEEKLALLALVLINQALDLTVTEEKQWRALLQQLIHVDRFYREIGGIIGYQVELLERLALTAAPLPTRTYHSPIFDDISTPDPAHIFSGLKALPFMAEIYPLGGAADRLHLVDVETGSELPAAKLSFAGRTLLEGLIRDVQAREWLYYRLFGKQLTTPIAMMTSWEKENHRHVLQICEAHRWFGRPRETFRCFAQPLVPTVDDRGQWHTVGPLKLLMKPGGHGALWKLARDEGVFAWLREKNRSSILVRQINNPIAGLDHGLLAFTGIGFSKEQSFGFASCPRRLRAAEGMNVIVEKEDGHIVLTNVEYCDFAAFGIEDLPLKEGEPFSRFSSNTNILYANLDAIERAVAKCPFPGLLVNLKRSVFLDEQGQKRDAKIARLESTMQNIADVFVEPKKGDAPLKPERTYVTYNHRHKTISVAKKACVPGQSHQETPELCFHELLLAHRELLDLCGVATPAERPPEEELLQGPAFVFLYHPALGPLYSIIQQKLRGGSIGEGAELLLEIAELDIENLSLQGSLCVRAERILGELDPEGLLQYSERVGRCRLHECSVVNRGVHWEKSRPYWEMRLHRIEALEIELRGHSEFDAKGVRFEGAEKFVVEDGERMVLRQENGVRRVWKERVGEKAMWKYEWGKDGVMVKSGG